mgnify:CR=1 FL=1
MGLEKATIHHLSELQNVCIDAYSQTYADHWTHNGLALYLEQEFGSNRLKSDLNDANCHYFFIKKDAETIGFIKINTKSSLEFSELDNCELDKIYLFPKYSGLGFGKTAMTKIIKLMQEKGKTIFFLCVIDSNKNAIAFYERLGFEYHSKTILDILYFKEDLKGMNRMCLKLS